MARLTIVLLLTVGIASSQQPSEFEVASVKPAVAGRARGGLTGGPGTSDPERISAESIDLKRLLMKAYDLETDQISGPGWIDSEKYAIAAKVAPGTTEEQFRIMLQNLLTERFKLTLHHEPKELSIYELMVAKGGPKLTAAAAKDPNDTDSDQPRAGPASMTLDKEGCPAVRPGVSSGSGRFGPGVTCSRFNNTSIEQLITSLEMFIGMADGSFGTESVHVIDKTGLDGKFDITLKVHLVMRFPGQPANPDDMEGPDIFTALEQQLGLKLQRTKETLDRIVIDSANKIPTDN
jgi:uncharacterized protein (TIGR03435 family)